MPTDKNRPVVRIKSGTVTGVREGNIAVFRGIPFAADPVGRLRWREPKPVEPWAGELDCSDFGPISPQPESPLASDFGETSPQSEACLNLNVWTTAPGAARLPVIVWIHGGGFFMGSGQAHLAGFADSGCVAVSLNYRLGALGFAALGNACNLGLLDQVAALEWVQANIQAFGGDPDNVTIFGCSAGGMSVCSLMAMPAARGLFHKAIAQSGAGSTASTLDEAVVLGEKLAQVIGIDVDDLDSLRRIDAAKVLDAQKQLQGDTPVLFKPFVDGEILPTTPLEAAVSGTAARVPLIIGTNRDEMKLAAMASGDSSIPALPAELVDSYTRNHPEMTQAEVLTRAATDARFTIPAVDFAEAHRKWQPDTWMYRFAWETPAWGGALGACHGLEVPFVMNALGEPNAIPLGENPPAALAAAMHRAWVTFATTGQPEHSGLADWPRYDIATRPTIELADPPKLRRDPDGADRELWSTNVRQSVVTW